MSLSLGNTTIGSLYLGSTKVGEAYLGSTKVYQGIVLPYETYFDFGSTYTLSSATAATIDIGATSLSTGTKPYVAFYMDITCTADTESGTRGTGVYITGSNSGNISVGLSDSRFTGLFARVTSGSSAKSVGLEATATPYDALKIIAYQSSSAIMRADIRYRDSSTGIWGVHSEINMTGDGSNLDPHSLTTLGSPGGRDGMFTTTNFKACGFDTIAEAEAWLES